MIVPIFVLKIIASIARDWAIMPDGITGKLVDGVAFFLGPETAFSLFAIRFPFEFALSVFANSRAGVVFVVSAAAGVAFDTDGVFLQTKASIGRIDNDIATGILDLVVTLAVRAAKSVIEGIQHLELVVLSTVEADRVFNDGVGITERVARELFSARRIENFPAGITGEVVCLDFDREIFTATRRWRRRAIVVVVVVVVTTTTASKLVVARMETSRFAFDNDIATGVGHLVVSVALRAANSITVRIFHDELEGLAFIQANSIGVGGFFVREIISAALFLVVAVSNLPGSVFGEFVGSDFDRVGLACAIISGGRVSGIGRAHV